MHAPPEDDVNKTGFVILVNGIWVPEAMDKAEIEEYDGCPPPIDGDDPVEGCTLHDVGWMKVLYEAAEIDGWVDVCNIQDWQLHYYHPPEIGFSVGLLPGRLLMQRFEENLLTSVERARAPWLFCLSRKSTD